MIVFGAIVLITLVLLGISHYLALEAVETWSLRRHLELVEVKPHWSRDPFLNTLGNAGYRGNASYIVFRVSVRLKGVPEGRIHQGHVRVPKLSIGSHDVDERWDGPTPGASLLALQARERVPAPELSPADNLEAEIRAEIAHRLDLLHGPDILKDDPDGNGQVDAEEWEQARQEIAAQVREEFSQGPEGSSW